MDYVHQAANEKQRLIRLLKDPIVSNDENKLKNSAAMEGGLGQKKLMFKDRLDLVNLKREWPLKIESGWLCSNFQLRSMGVLYQSVSQPYRPVSTMLSLLSPLSLSVVGVKHSKPWKFFSQFDILNAWTWLHLPALLTAFYHQVHSSALWELVFFRSDLQRHLTALYGSCENEFDLVSGSP